MRLDADAHLVAWLVWHLWRVPHDHVAAALPPNDLWETDRWRKRPGERVALPDDVTCNGYPCTRARVGAVRVTAELLSGYYGAVHASAPSPP